MVIRRSSKVKVSCSTYIENLTAAIVYLLISLKVGDKVIDKKIDEFKDQVKKIKYEEDTSKLVAFRNAIADFVIEHDEFVQKRKAVFNNLLLNNISLLVAIAKTAEADKRWRDSLERVKEILKQKIDVDTLTQTKEILFRLGTTTKDSKDVVYRNILQILFSLLDVESDDDRAKKYLEKVKKLQSKLVASPYRIDEKEIRDEMRELVEEKERLEEEYIDSLQTKLNKALKALIYTITTFTSSSSDYVSTFQGHIDEINNAINSKNIDVDELSKRLIGIAVKIKDTTISMKNEIEQYSKKLKESQEIIEDLREKLKKAQENLIIDPLTGVYNRRGLIHFLKVEIARAERYKQPLSIIMADLDHFSNVNNTYGHLAGDMVLKGFCKTVKSIVRSADVVARYGGEEFIVILPNTDLDSAFEVAEKLRLAVQKLKFKYKDKIFSITSSFGVAAFREKDTIETLIKRADKALYKAKEKRNCTVKETEL